ncbi:MAG: phage tail tape measure protein [Ruminococcus sp.]|nr:phage tail tape measure protein [Ruminococcus sp.]
MAMAGWSVDDTLNSVSAVMDLAAASGEDLATVSDIVTDSMTALGIAADGEYADGISNASHYADVLAATATSANTDVSTLGESFKYCAPIAGTLGASAEDLSIALGLMANSGIKGSQAENSLKNALVNMSKPTEAQAAAMESLGLKSPMQMVRTNLCRRLWTFSGVQ